MRWISVDESHPPVGVDVLCFRPTALLDWNDKPLRMCHYNIHGIYSGCHEVTHWLDIDMPPGWTDDMGKRQHA